MKRIEIYCPVWGSELPFSTFLENAKEAGYDGVEMPLPLDKTKRIAIINEVSQSGLKLIVQQGETNDVNFELHLANFKNRLNDLAADAPQFICSQTGKDYFTFEQNEKLILAAAEISATTGVRIIHETHRSKFSFAAHITKPFLDKHPSLQLGLDISHWCCVAETMLEDQQEAVDKALEHTFHIHARVGYQEGPQVIDPRAPEWADIVEKHLDWWGKVLAKNTKLGLTTTFTPEFGPFPYMIRLPYTQMNIYNQWDVNVYMMGLLRARFGEIAI